MITKHTHICSPLLVALSSQPGCANKSNKWSSAHARTPWQPRRISTDIHSARCLQWLVAVSLSAAGFSHLFFCITHCLWICYCKSSLKLSLQKTGELNVRRKQWLAPPLTLLYNYYIARFAQIMAAFLKQLASPRVLAVAAAGAGAIVAGRYYLSGCSDAGAATGQPLALCMLSNIVWNFPLCAVRIGWGAAESENVLSTYYPLFSFLSCLSYF